MSERRLGELSVLQPREVFAGKDPYEAGKEKGLLAGLIDFLAGEPKRKIVTTDDEGRDGYADGYEQAYDGAARAAKKKKRK